MATLSKPEIAKAPVQDVGSIARTILECFNSRDLDKAVSFIAPDCEFTVVPMGFTFRGPEGVRSEMSAWIQAFPDARVEIRNVIPNGDIVSVEFIGRGTHNGPMLGPDGSVFPATGNRVEIPICEVIQLRNGKVFRDRMYYDLGTLLRQIQPPLSTKTIVRKNGEGTALWMLGMLYEVKASKLETNGEVSIMQMTLPPGTSAPPHVHDCGETVFMLEGSVRCHLGESNVKDLSPGDLVYYPKGTEEWMENVSDKPAKVLVTYSPGGMDEFFAEAGEPAKARVIPPSPTAPPDVARLTEIAARHGLQLRVK